MGFRSLSAASLLADGTEQIILEGTTTGRFSGHVDLSEMQAGDTVEVKQYLVINGSYRSYNTENYSGVQSEPALYITPKESTDGVRVTLRQTAGVMRSFAYQFIVEEILSSKGFRL